MQNKFGVALKPGAFPCRFLVHMNCDVYEDSNELNTLFGAAEWLTRPGIAVEAWARAQEPDKGGGQTRLCPQYTQLF